MIDFNRAAVGALAISMLTHGGFWARSLIAVSILSASPVNLTIPVPSIVDVPLLALIALMTVAEALGSAITTGAAGCGATAKSFKA